MLVITVWPLWLNLLKTVVELVTWSNVASLTTLVDVLLKLAKYVHLLLAVRATLLASALAALLPESLLVQNMLWAPVVDSSQLIIERIKYVVGELAWGGCACLVFYKPHLGGQRNMPRTDYPINLTLGE